MIGFIGTVFSPWYHWSGRRRPQNHVCLNVVTWGGSPRFTMTDRGESALRQSRESLQIGPSRMTWANGALVIEIDEKGAAPRFGRVRGKITLTPEAVTRVEAVLDPGARHIWRPFAPLSRIKVELDGQPAWKGHGYFDANFGARPLETDFRRWTWGRYAASGRGVVFYDGLRRDGSTLGLSLGFDALGQVTETEAPPLVAMKPTAWRLPRETRADAGTTPRQTAMLLDAPFYSRAAVDVTLGGEQFTGVHEALDLDRYAWPWLKPMIALRVPRSRA
ncbi:carotenoid 1,2-hydratase [Stagnihabitans tardus]|uniref:Carotenoid 1,2-hydratase n=1 Tax=Stagnihabitans tardus TaxID=2699202 RepID=A0AAE4Y785_9RHOB|nr:carotenoid 1,2-hydratase [Stagnihabitans tardus]